MSLGYEPCELCGDCLLCGARQLGVDECPCQCGYVRTEPDVHVCAVCRIGGDVRPWGRCVENLAAILRSPATLAAQNILSALSSASNTECAHLPFAERDQLEHGVILVGRAAEVLHMPAAELDAHIARIFMRWLDIGALRAGERGRYYPGD